MKHASYTAFWLIVVVLSNQAYAGFGTDEEAAKAAAEEKEPAYLADFMSFFSERIASFAQRMVTETPAQRLALLNSVEILLRLAHLDAIDAAQAAAIDANTPLIPLALYEEAGRAAFNTGLAAAHQALRDAVKDAWARAGRPTTVQTVESRRERRASRNRIDELRHAARNLAQRAALSEIERAATVAGATTQLVGRVAYRVAERVIFNELANDLELRLRATYEAELRRVPTHFTDNHPFIDVNGWQTFLLMYFDGRPPATATFIAPIGILLDQWMNVRPATQFQMARHRNESLVSLFPLDIVRVILIFVAPLVYQRFPTSTGK